MAVTCAVVLAVLLAILPATAQKTPSAKDLVRQAEIDQKSNQWEAARDKLKRAAAQKPKDKKILDLLQTTETYLADQAAARAITACEQYQIDKCEKETALAASYATTPRVQEAQGRLAARRKEVTEQWNRAQKMIEARQLAEAVVELENLNRFSYLFPNLAAEKERVRRLRVESFLDQGQKEMHAQKWDAAMEQFSAALRLDTGNAEAARGIESGKKEKEAGGAFLQAQNAFKAKGYQVAYDAHQKALKLFPSRQPYIELGKQIGAEWSKVLVDEAKQLSGNPENLKDNQKALEKLEMARRLDPRFPELVDHLKTVRLQLQNLYVDRAGKYEAFSNASRIGIAYMYYQGAQQTNPGAEFGFSAKLKEVDELFRRKRAAQLLVSVDNLSPSPAAYPETLARIARSVLQKFGLADLRLRSLDEYEKSPSEDPQFVENRPDGKSPTALVRIELNNYESESTGGDKPMDKASKYISGQENVPNPQYEKAYQEFMKVSAALAAEKPKPGKATKDGYTTGHQQILQQQLSTLPREVSKDKVSDYTYQEYNLGVRSLVKMNLEVRDYLDKQLLGSDAIEASEQRTQIEIQGVRDKDINNVMNRTARLPPADQLLQESHRKVQQQLEEKLPRLITPFLDRFYNEAERALKENRGEDALENFLCHWYFFKGKMDPTRLQRIRDFVRFETGLDLAPGL